jgi:thiol-disulfide isomerase/thioredoxin
MRNRILRLHFCGAARLLAVAACVTLALPIARAQDRPPAVTDALNAGDAFAAAQKYDQALDAYRRADALSNHTCATCYLDMFNAECMLGDLPAALDDALHAANAAGDDRALAADAHVLRASLLSATASSATDDRFNQAAQEYRDALALDPQKSIAHYDLGLLLLFQGRDTEGVEELTAFVNGPLASPIFVERAKRLIEDPSRGRLPSAEDFSFVTLEGDHISNDSLRGKVVLFDFWATWCPACRESTPVMAELHQKYASAQFQMIGISGDSDQDAWQKYIREHSMNWSEFIDLDGQINGLFQIDAFPTFIVLDRDGNVLFRQAGLGEDTESQIAATIDAALKRPASLQPRAPSATAAPAAAQPPPVDRAAVASSTRALFVAQAQASLVPLGALSAVALNSESAATPGASSNGNLVSPPEDVEDGDAGGNIYRNAFLGLRYKFPDGWTAAEPDVLDQLNRKARRWMEDHPAADALAAFPDTIFQASPNPRQGMPFVRITVAVAGPQTGEMKGASSSAISLDMLNREADDLKSGLGATVVAPPHAVALGAGQAYALDFELPSANPPVWATTIEMVVRGRYRVSLEIYATSQQELGALSATVRNLIFSPVKP